jgi:MFS family permease
MREAPVYPDGKVPMPVQLGVFGAGALSNSGTVMVWVLVPLWMTELEAAPFAIGLAIGIRSLIPLFLSIPGGALMDRLGIRNVMLVFCLIGVILPPLYPLLPWVGAVIVLQAFAGLATSMGWIGAQALIGHLMNSDPLYAGRLSFAVRIATLVCPVVAGTSWDLWGAWGGFGMLWLWGVIQFVCVLMVPSDPPPEGKRTRLRAADLMPRWSDYTTAFSLMVIPIVTLVVVVSTLRMSASAVQGSFLVVYMKEVGMTGTQTGLLISAGSVFGSMSTLTSRGWAKVFPEYWVLMVAAAMGIIGVTLVPLFVSFWSLMALTIFRALGTGVSQPLMISLGQSAAGREHHGKMAALRTTTNRLAEGLIPIIMGGVVELAGLNASFLIVGSVLLALMAIVAVVVYRHPVSEG